MRKIVPVASQKIKCFSNNVSKEGKIPFNENYGTLKKEAEEDIRKGKISPSTRRTEATMSK